MTTTRRRANAPGHGTKAVTFMQAQPTGLCECGCGQFTQPAKHTNGRSGTVAGQPRRFLHGHHKRVGMATGNPNPSGLCQCGCGLRTPIAAITKSALGHVKGQPVNYISGHNRRKPRAPTPGPSDKRSVFIPVLIPGDVTLFAVVDAEDAGRVSAHSWHRKANGYAQCTVSRKKVLLHRFILGLEHGDGLSVDHIDRNPLDNRKANLRVVTQAQNAQNVGVNRSNTSGFRGVRRHRAGWQARATVDGRTRHLGTFDTKEEAARIVSAWRAEHMPFSEIDRPR